MNQKSGAASPCPDCNSNPLDRRNMFVNAIGEGLWGFKANLIASATVLAVLLREHGASAKMFGLLDGIEKGMMLFPQLAGIFIFSSRRRLRRRLIYWHIFAILPLFLVMGLLCFAVGGGLIGNAFFRWIMVLVYAACLFANGVALAAWTDFLGHLFPVAMRGKAIGLSTFLSNLLGAGGALLAGWLIQRNPGVNTFAWLYVAAWAFGSLTMCTWWFVDDHNLQSSPEPQQPALRHLLKYFQHSIGDKNYRAFLAGRIIASLGFCVTPFVAVHFLSEAGGRLASGTIVSCGAALTVAASLGGIFFGWLGDRHGHRLGILAGAVAQIFALIVLLSIPGAIGCVLAYIGVGLVFSNQVSVSNLLLETCPHDQRVAHISAGNLVVGLPMTVLPLLAGWLAQAKGNKTLFAVSLGVSLASLLWFIFCLKDPRDMRHPELEASIGVVDND